MEINEIDIKELRKIPLIYVILGCCPSANFAVSVYVINQNFENKYVIALEPATTHILEAWWKAVTKNIKLPRDGKGVTLVNNSIVRVVSKVTLEQVTNALVKALPQGTKFHGCFDGNIN